MTWFRSWAIVYSTVQQVGLHDTYCASSANPLYANGMGFYVTLFYLSKCTSRTPALRRAPPPNRRSLP